MICSRWNLPIFRMKLYRRWGRKHRAPINSSCCARTPARRGYARKSCMGIPPTELNWPLTKLERNMFWSEKVHHLNLKLTIDIGRLTHNAQYMQLDCEKEDGIPSVCQQLHSICYWEVFHNQDEEMAMWNLVQAAEYEWRQLFQKARHLEGSQDKNIVSIQANVTFIKCHRISLR